MSEEGAAVGARRSIAWRALWPWMVLLLAVLVAFLLDWPVYHALKDVPRPPLAVKIVRGVRWYGTTLWYFIITIPVLLAAGYWLKDARKILTGKAGCIGAATTATIIGLLKHTTGRLRPRSIGKHGLEAGFHGPGAIGDVRSFPSGDAAAAFCFAYIIGYYFPALRWPLYFIAAVVALGRIAVNAHWSSDVIAGAAVGILAGWIGCRVVAWWDRRAASRRQAAAD